MDKKRTLRCDCGEELVPDEREFDDLKTEAMVCPLCGFTTLTKEQAQRLLQLKTLQGLLRKERKIIKVGNSIGLTLPEKLTEMGVHVDQKVKITPLDTHSLTLSFE